MELFFSLRGMCWGHILLSLIMVMLSIAVLQDMSENSKSNTYHYSTMAQTVTPQTIPHIHGSCKDLLSSLRPCLPHVVSTSPNDNVDPPAFDCCEPLKWFFTISTKKVASCMCLLPAIAKSNNVAINKTNIIQVIRQCGISTIRLPIDVVACLETIPTLTPGAPPPPPASPPPPPPSPPPPTPSPPPPPPPSPPPPSPPPPSPSPPPPPPPSPPPPPPPSPSPPPPPPPSPPPPSPSPPPPPPSPPPPSPPPPSPPPPSPPPPSPSPPPPSPPPPSPPPPSPPPPINPPPPPPPSPPPPPPPSPPPPPPPIYPPPPPPIYPPPPPPIATR